MCGRARLAVPAEELAEAFDAILPAPAPFATNLNIAPTDAVLVLRMNEAGRREIVPIRWGMVPFYEPDFDRAKPLINARAETAARRPEFREAFAHKRCFVLVDGFYEWQHVRQPGTKGVRKLPYSLRRPDGTPFAMAGLWQRWRGEDGSVRECCTVLTRDAPPSIAALHDRMPVVLEGKDLAAWLDPGIDSAGARHVLDHAVTEDWVATPLAHMPSPPTRRQLGLFD